ncbi:secretin receptor [Trichinella spiralis]|uniref:secretin receptor n=1 Tax=Trichinella spiralis TaxID=6334 RepID=UPI0001EFC621|nr:secretin receptor [Trichinella spiralis]
MERVNVFHTTVVYFCFNSSYSRKWKNTCTVVHDIAFRLQVSGSSEEAYINGIRYERKFSAIYVKKNCPIAVCERPCASFQMFRNCPYCDCNGSAVSVNTTFVAIHQPMHCFNRLLVTE